MKITLDRQNQYRFELDTLAKMASEYMDASFDAYIATYPDASVADIRTYMTDALKSTMGAFGDQAGDVANSLFDEICAGEGIDAQANTKVGIDEELAEKKIRYFARDLTNGDSANFKKNASELAEYYVKRCAYETTLANCSANKVRYARVPSGRETCSFCIMLASRDFVYHSAATAHGKHGVHRYCDCIILPGVKGQTEVEGYDSMAYYRLWRRLENAKTYENRLYNMSVSEIRANAEEFDKELNKLWHKQKIQHDYAGIFEKYLNNHSGDGCITSQYWSKPEGKELQVASWLATKGHDVEFLLPSSAKGDRTPDIRLDGELWEIKRIDTDKRMKVKRRVSDALKQSENVIVDLSCNENAKELINSVVKVLDDERANQIIIITERTATLYRK